MPETNPEDMLKYPNYSSSWDNAKLHPTHQTG